MDVIKSLNGVANLNQYISLSQEVTTQGKSAMIQFNLTTVLALHNFRSLEIEYINKFEENGVASFIMERLLALPPSKTWDLLAKQVIFLIQDWLQAIWKHLMNHSHNWWTFLRQLLTYIKDMIVKASCIPDLLVEHTTECLLELATADRPDTSQRYEILHTLNLYCSESRKEIRFVMRNKFSPYFVKLCTQMAICGYLPCQFSMLECVIRWLVPRDDAALRSSVANKWFPPDLYPNNAVQMFLRSDWSDFFHEAREFLNMVNYANGLVTSAICRRLFIGNLNVIHGGERQQYWVDVNSSESVLSVLLEHSALARLAPAATGPQRACQALRIHADDVHSVQLHSENDPITLSISMTKPVSVRPSHSAAAAGDVVTVHLSTRTDLRKMDVALTLVFGDKYKALLNISSPLSMSPEKSFNKGIQDSGDDTRFSNPEVKRKRHGGYITRTRHGGINTPSSVSTSSLLQLRDKLTALPRITFDKEPVRVVREPALPCVSEFTERDDRSISSMSTLKLYPTYKSGVCQRTVRTNKSQSHGVTDQNCPKSQSDSEALINRTKTSPKTVKNISDDNTSLVINTCYKNNPNDTVEPMTTNINHNIVDRIIQEAFQRDSGVRTDENKKSDETETSEAIEGTPVNEIEKPKRRKKPKPKVCTVVSTTTDESNTEVVKETPLYVNVRNRRNKDKENDASKTFDVNDVENFFSQHFSEAITSEIVKSPTLPSKINETTSKSKRFEGNLLILNENSNSDKELFQVDEMEIIECLNDIVDKVCKKVDRSTPCVNEEVKVGNTNEIQVEKDPNLTSTPKKQNEHKPAKGRKARSKKPDMKIKLKTPKKQKTKRVTAKEANSSKAIQKKMSTIVEQTEESVVEANETVEVNRRSPILMLKIDNQKQTPINRRKRKLYSPSADDIEIEKAPKMSVTDDDEILANFQTKTKPTSSASCYKEIEKERKRYIRSKPRRSGKRFAEPQSPRTVQKNNIFDNLKETVENTEKITIADRNTKEKVYNFTSESEDEDFIKKKTEGKNRMSSTGTSMTSLRSNLRGRKNTRKNYSERESSNDDKNKKPVVKRRQTKMKMEALKRKAIVVVEPLANLVDERMRKTTDVLNSSIIINQPEQEEIRDIEPLINDRHEMEPVEIEPPKNTTSRSLKLKKTKIIKVKTEKANNEKVTKNELKAKNNELKVVTDKDGDGTISPLPGLVVEVAPEPKQDANDSLTTNMLQKFKRIYQEGHDVNETNTTQYMLSDVERNNNSQQHRPSVEYRINFASHDKTTVIGDDETIAVGDNQRSKKATLRKTRKSIEEYMDDVMEICSIPDRNSDISIATDGITAHGDVEEDPPSLKNIKRLIQGNRQVVDLNQSVKEYFEKLSNEINSCNSVCIASPVVSVQKLSMDDVRKYLPSCRSSETEEEPRNSNTNKSTQRENKSMSSDKSPVIAITRISNEDMKRFLSSCKLADTDSEKSEQNDVENPNPKDIVETPQNLSGSSNSPVVAVTRMSLKEFNKWLPPIPFNRNSDDSDSDSENDNQPTQPSTSDNLKLVFRNDTENLSPKTVKRKIVKKASTSDEVSPKKASEFYEISPKLIRLTRSHTRKSLISPVRSFEDFAQHLQSDNISDEDYSKTEKSPHNTRSSSKKDARILINSQHKTDAKITETSQEKSDAGIFEIPQKFNPSKSSPKNLDGSIRSSLKRASSPIIKGGKRPRYEETVADESGPSVSSVHEWFKRNEAQKPRDYDPLQQYNDTCTIIMENIETTLMEQNHITSKELVNLFVYVDERIKIVEDNLKNVRVEVKEKALEILKKDHKRKSDFVTLLKEDVKAVFGSKQ